MLSQPSASQNASFASRKRDLRKHIVSTIQLLANGTYEENKPTFDTAFEKGKQDYYEATSIKLIGQGLAGGILSAMERSRINEPLKLKPTDEECYQIGIPSAIYRYLKAKQKDQDEYTILYKYYVVQAILGGEPGLGLGRVNLTTSASIFKKVESFIELFQAELQDHLFLAAKPNGLLYPNESIKIDSKIETVLTNLTHEDLQKAFNSVILDRLDLREQIWSHYTSLHSFWKSSLPRSVFSYFLLKKEEALDTNRTLKVNTRANSPVELLDAFLHLTAKDTLCHAQSISYLFIKYLTGISLRKADTHGNVYSAQELDKHALECINQFRNKVPAKCYQAGCPANEVRRELLREICKLG